MTRATPTGTTPTRTTPSSSALGRAIEPVETERFLAEHWERKPLVVPRGEEGRFDDLLSARDVERLITETGIRTPGFRLVKAGATVSGYTTDLAWRPAAFTGVADVPRVLEEFEPGATIVLQGLHHLWLPLARYCRQLEAYFGHPVQANAYYTPAGSQGLPVHHDTHEVISLQVAGAKRWLVYEPALELPLKNQRYRSALGAPGEPVLDVTLRAGDTLYLPRGWLHQALTSDEDSLHITVGINVRRWIDEARAELDEAESELAFRQTMTPRSRRSCRRSTPTPPGRAHGRASSQPTPDPRRPALRATRARQAHPDTELERRDTVIADSTGRPSSSRAGPPLPGPARAGARVPRHDRGTVPRLGAARRARRAGRLVLVRRLVREGFLRRVLRPAEPFRRASEVGRLALLEVDVDLVGRPAASTSARQPSPSPASNARDVVEAE